MRFGTLSSSAIAGGALVGSPGAAYKVVATGAWKVIGTGNFNADSWSDIILQNSSRAIVIWQVDGTVLTYAAPVATPAPPYAVVGSADFDGDAESELLLQNTSTGDVAIWYLNGTGTAIASGHVLGGGSMWKVVGAADLTGDGKAEIFLQKTSSGDVAIWQLNASGTAIATGAALGGAGTSWKLLGSGDTNGDGRSDLILQNTSMGDVAVWHRDAGATTIASGAVLGGPGPSWTATVT